MHAQSNTQLSNDPDSLSDQRGTSVDQPCVNLNQVRSGIAHRKCSLRRVDSPDSNDREIAAQLRAKLSNHVQGKGLLRLPAETTRVAVRNVSSSIANDRRIRCDDPVNWPDL